MRSLLAIARYTFLQQFRNRLYLVVVLFGLLMMGATLLFGALAGDQEVRVILDLGLVTAELFGLATAVFGAVTLVLEEMESKTIYLILTRPLPRPVYVVGRFAGLFIAVAVSIILMEILHFGLLYFKGWTPDPAVWMALPMMGLKVMVMTALTLLCSLTFTSVPTATVFSILLWVLGHFGNEIRFMGEKAGGAAVTLAAVFCAILPDMTLLNARDMLDYPGFNGSVLGHGFLYAGLYTLACLALSSALFSRKEF
ncbi:MAG: ABC transporter permease [Elusimicrobia bacterium]|nr:ABC transporter permease [Elusimicrobiota bacterium]